MIPKGCTCENSFSFPYEENEVESIHIAYKENKVMVLEKHLEDCIFQDGKIVVALSQEDTLKFTDNAFIKIQIRVKFKNGIATKSNIIETHTDDVIYNGVI